MKKWELIYRAGVVLCALAIALAGGFLVGRGNLPPEIFLIVAAAPIGLLFFYLRLRRFENGIMAILIAAGLVRPAIPTGTASYIVASLIVALMLVSLWIVEMMIVTKRIRLKPSPVNKPVLAFVAVSIIAYIWSNIFADPLLVTWSSYPIVQLAALVVMILLPMMTLLVFNKVEDLIWLKRITWFMLGLGMVAVVGRLTGSSIIHNVDIKSPVIAIHDRGLFVAWFGSLAYAQALFNEKLSLWLRGLLLIGVAAWIYYGFVLTILWVSGWLPLLVVCTALTFFRSKKLFALGVFVVILYFLLNFDFYWQEIVVSNEEEGSGSSRVALWLISLNHVFHHPFFGMGPGGYMAYYITYHPNELHSTHNNYFDILAQVGFIGFLIYLWIFFTLMWMGYQTCRALSGQRNFEEAFANATLAGCFAVLAAMMLGDWVIPFAYNQTISGFDNAVYSWIMLGGLATLHGLVIKPKPHNLTEG
jgi:O-antigen ligase